MVPTREILRSVAVDAVIAVLQDAGERGGRYALRCPPEVSKSLVAGVLFPARLLLRSRGQARIIGGSYSWDFAKGRSVVATTTNSFTAWPHVFVDDVTLGFDVERTKRSVTSDHRVKGQVR